MDPIVDLGILNRPMTAEEQRRALEAIEQAVALREQILAARGGRPFPPAEDDLADLRAERDARQS